MDKRVSAAAAAIVVVTGMLTATSPAKAQVGIQVAPSANGLVMEGVPTTLSATGLTSQANVYRFDERSGKWSRMGPISNGKPLSYTFPMYGRIKLKVVPKGKPGTLVRVPVYGRFVSTTDPMTFGDVQLPNGRPVSALEQMGIMPASADCALVDVGLLARAQPGSSASGTLVVKSTGAPEQRLSVTDSGATLLGVPIRGDVVVSLVDYVNPNDSASMAGIVWYCVGPLKLVRIPSDSGTISS